MKSKVRNRFLSPLALWVLLVAAFAGTPFRKVEAKPWVTAYVGSWWFNWDDNGAMPMRDINFNGMTVCDYMAINPSATAPFIDTSNNYSINMDKLTSMAHAAGIKCTLTCGSWATETNFLIAAKPSNLPTFVDSLVSFVKAHNFDGVDIDWEPLLETDSSRYVGLMQALRQALPSPQYIITTTAGNGFAYSVYAAAQDDVDQINLMTYDLGYPASGYTSIYAGAVYSAGHVDPFDNKTPVSSCNYLVQQLEAAGVSASKIGIGCEPGGQLWPGISGPYQSIANVKNFKQDISYNTIMAAYYDSTLYHWDPVAKASYLSDSSSNSSADWFLSYDDTTALKAKLSYIDSAGIGGLIIYEIGMCYDKTDSSNPFLAVTQRFLDGVSAVNGPSRNIPNSPGLAQNYPNPFNPTTRIEYSIAKRGQVSLDVFNVLGEKVATLYSGVRSPGDYSATFNGASLASGVYFYRLETGNGVITKKLVLLK